MKISLYLFLSLLLLPGAIAQFNFTCGGFYYGIVTIYSPDYPSYYADNLSCPWYLDTWSQGVKLTFETFATQPDRDYVTVWEGWDTSVPPVMEKRSGTWSPFVVEVLNNNRATVLFTSDESGTDRGFLAKVEEIRLTTTKDPIYGCGSTLTGDSGELSSPNYPGDYFNNWDCQTLIRVASGKRIQVNFTDLQTEERFDYVAIYDGPTTNSPSLLVLSGTAVPSAITSSSNEVVVRFVADASQNNFRGWHLTYTAI